MAAEIGKGVALGAATVAVVAATGGAGAVAGGALAATETAGAMEAGGAATSAASAATGVAEAGEGAGSVACPACAYWREGLRLLNRRRRLLPLLHPRIPALKLLLLHRHRKAAFGPGPCEARQQHSGPARWERTRIIRTTANRQGGINSGRSSENSIALRPRPPRVG